MMGEALALFVPASAVALVVRPSAVRWDRSMASLAMLALCLGLGFSSVTATALIASGVAPATRGFVLADAAIWLLVGAAGWWLRQAGRAALPSSTRPRTHVSAPRVVEWIPCVAFGLTAIAALASVVAATAAAPHGDWDAWAIWNQHARFLFRGGGSDAWRAMFAVEWAQPDYPLLLPASVARMWAYAGQETTTGPALIAIVFGTASVVLVMGALEGVARWIAGALTLGAATFLSQIAAQCADVPLACFMVATLVVASGREGIWSGERSARMRALVAGATGAMAAWTKNEGLVFLVVVLLVAAAIAVRRGAGRQLLWGIAGAVPVAITIGWFKLTLAPPSALFESLAISLARVADLDRHETVALLMAQHLMRWGSPRVLGIVPLMGLAAAWLAMRGDAVRRAPAAIVGLMFVSYYVVYVTTPFEIAWHVSSSFDRLVVQLWPSLVLAVFVGFGPREGSRTWGSSSLGARPPALGSRRWAWHG